MAKTFEEIRLMLADIYMSNIDPDDMVNADEEKAQVVRSLNSTHTELMGKYVYSFLVRNKDFTTVRNKKDYEGVEGQILYEGLKVKDSQSPLQYDEEAYLLEEKLGTPTKFWLDEKENINLYPTPDSPKTYNVRYLDYRYALTPNGELTDDYADSNTINMPERLQNIYIEWLVYQTLGDYMRNQAKPRWQPTLDIAERKRAVFMQQCNAYDGELRFII